MKFKVGDELESHWNEVEYYTVISVDSISYHVRELSTGKFMDLSQSFVETYLFPSVRNQTLSSVSIANGSVIQNKIALVARFKVGDILKKTSGRTHEIIIKYVKDNYYAFNSLNPIDPIEHPSGVGCTLDYIDDNYELITPNVQAVQSNVDIANGRELDVIGDVHGVKRQTSMGGYSGNYPESDSDYRQRIKNVINQTPPSLGWGLKCDCGCATFYGVTEPGPRHSDWCKIYRRAE